MCIIVVKKSGIEMPEKDTLEECFRCNKDGAGYMYYSEERKRVIIQKGFMDFDSFYKAIEKENFTKDNNVIMHFRISTAGGIKPEICHPYPITNNVDALKFLSCHCAWGMCHNGCISNDHGPDMSDTMKFVIDILCSPLIYPHLNTEHVWPILKGWAGNSRFALLNDKNKIITWGEGWQEEKGVMYSNGSFRKYVSIYNSTDWKNKDDDYGYWMRGIRGGGSQNYHGYMGLETDKRIQERNNLITPDKWDGAIYKRDNKPAEKFNTVTGKREVVDEKESNTKCGVKFDKWVCESCGYFDTCKKMVKRNKKVEKKNKKKKASKKSVEGVQTLCGKSFDQKSCEATCINFDACIKYFIGDNQLLSLIETEELPVIN